MKFLVVFAVFAAVATAEHAAPQNERLLNVIGAIINQLRPPVSVGPAIIEGSPISIGPAIIDGSPISVGPAIIDDSPISVGPAIVDDSPISVGPAIVDDSPISVGPAIVDESPISVGPAIIDESINVEGVKPTPVSPFPDFSGLRSPLVQVIVNVKTDSVSGNPVVVEGPKPTPPEIKPTPVIVVEQPEIEPTPVIVVDQPQPAPEPVIIAPIEVAPVINLPDILN